jgi:hypothetical protein
MAVTETKKDATIHIPIKRQWHSVSKRHVEPTHSQALRQHPGRTSIRFGLKSHRRPLEQERRRRHLGRPIADLGPSHATTRHYCNIDFIDKRSNRTEITGARSSNKRRKSFERTWTERDIEKCKHHEHRIEDRN